MIKEYNEVNQNILKEVEELIAACNAHDGIKGMVPMDTSFNFNKEMNTIFLRYEDEKLVSALTIFAPGKNEAEIYTMTLPQYRQKGYFKELVRTAEKELKKYSVPDIIFVCEERSAAGKAAIERQVAAYDFTEYTLSYNHSLDKEFSQYEYRLEFHRADETHIEDIAKVSMSAFGDSYEGAKAIATNILNAVNRKMFLGKIDGQYVAMGVVAADNGSNSIHGLGVLAEQQGKGYGKEMLYAILKDLIEHNEEKISLEVDSENQNAFQLYKKTGFEVKSAWEYYRRAVK